MSKFKVRLSDIAQEKLTEILNYIELEWSLTSRNKFLRKFDEKINQISNHPKSCQESEESIGLYKEVVEKHISFFYRINGKTINILYVFDNRESPEKIKNKIQ